MCEPWMVKVCPICDSFAIDFRKTTNDYRCARCHGVFEQPVQRLKKLAFPKFLEVKAMTDKQQAEKVLARREQYHAKELARRAHEAEKKAQRSATWQAYKARRWEQKIAESTTRWHEKFGGDGNDSSGDMPKMQQ